MAVEVRIPTLGESITEGMIVRWIKQEGELVSVDEPILELETEKASVEIPAANSGRLHILKAAGSTVQVGEVVATIEPEVERPGSPVAQAAPQPGHAARVPPPMTAAERLEEPSASGTQPIQEAQESQPAQGVPLSPAVRRLVEEHRLDVNKISGSGKGGRITKADVLAHLETREQVGQMPSAAPESPPGEIEVPPIMERGAPAMREGEERGERRVPMTPLRRRIAERLVQAQRTAAILTTFNEIDMSAVLELRSRYRDRFQKRHAIGLGLMSFFAKACVAALREIPVVNASIDGDEIVYHDYVHLGIAVATERGLVVPVIHHADRLSFAEIEREIERLATLAREGKLGIADLTGGTFTITNGGVFGSLLSTPILNPPQSGILGMHKIEKRPVIRDEQIAIRPMMYVALSYDHRLVDGEQAVTFLVRVKERIEDPARLLLDV